MGSDAHIVSNLPLKKFTIPIDKENTTALFHYDISANSHDGRIKPYGSYIDDSTILHYDMADLTTTSQGDTYIIDKSPHGNYGKVDGPTIANGRNGKALSFDGINDYAIISNNFIADPTSLTISAWFKRTGTGTNYECVIHKGADTTIGSTEYWLGCNKTNNIVATIGARTGIGWAAGQTTIIAALNTWYHVVATWDGSNVVVYVNGVIAKQYALATYSSLVTETRLGASSNGANYQLNGIIDKIVILNRAISEEEVKQRYNEGIYTLRSDGKYGGAIAVEESSTNLLCNYLVPTTHVHSDIDGWELLGVSNDNPRKNVASNIPLSPSTTYTLSAIYWSSNNILDDVYLQFNDSGWTEGGIYHQPFIGQGGRSIVSTDILPNGYKRYTATFTTNPLTTSINRIFFDSDIPNIRCFLGNIQLEQKSFATSFINGSREKGKLYYSTNIASPATISFWLKPTVPDNYSLAYNWVLSTIPYSNNLLVWKRPMETNYMMRINGVDVVVPVGAISYNKWSHIVITSNTSSSKVYIDGKYINSGGILPAITTLVLGYAEGTYNYSGNNMFDELRIDGVARTEEEIKAWHVSESPFFPKGTERIIT